jgi:transposase
VHDSACACPSCGGALKSAGEDVAEMLEWVADHYKVLRHVRPKFSCTKCEKLVQARAPSRPIARGLAGPGLNIEAYLRYLFEHLPDPPINRIEELLPWAIVGQLSDLKLAA